MSDVVDRLGRLHHLYDASDLQSLGFDPAHISLLLKRDTAVAASIVHSRAARRFLTSSRRVFALWEAGAHGTKALHDALREGDSWAKTLDRAEDLRDGVEP